MYIILYTRGKRSKEQQKTMVKIGCRKEFVIQILSCGSVRYCTSVCIMKNKHTGTIARMPGSEHPSDITVEIENIIEEQMHCDDKTTASQLYTASLY